MPDAGVHYRNRIIAHCCLVLWAVGWAGSMRLSQVCTATWTIITQLKHVNFNAHVCCVCVCMCVSSVGVRVCVCVCIERLRIPSTRTKLHTPEPEPHCLSKRYTRIMWHTHTYIHIQLALMFIFERTAVINQYLVMSLHKSHAHTRTSWAHNSVTPTVLRSYLTPHLSRTECARVGLQWACISWS